MPLRLWCKSTILEPMGDHDLRRMIDGGGGLADRSLSKTVMLRLTLRLNMMKSHFSCGAVLLVLPGLSSYALMSLPFTQFE
jgi:hypothetical protein